MNEEECSLKNLENIATEKGGIRALLDEKWRKVYQANAPREVPHQQQPKLSPEQQREALVLLGAGLSLRQVAAQFPGVSYGAMWRLARRRGVRKEGGLMG